LPERMSMPRRPGAGFERDTDTKHSCRFVGLEQGINSYSPGKIFGRPFAGRLLTTSLDIHWLSPGSELAVSPTTLDHDFKSATPHD
jgi:hypothetical protein